MSVIGRLTVVHETSVSDILVIDGRLSAFQNFDHVDQCTAECSLESQCVSLAFSPATGSCQLYKYDVANFTVDVITQKQTIFFKVVCERHDYTYIRPLNVCMKMYHDERTSDESRDTCKEDGADLLRIDTSAKMAYLKPVLAHIS
ncbi:uncharacterized protein LOC132744185, partial [Ruditapes philippinarum]|uniref:uncharacterized protein LOC132744185 n=1 Tax=Ruditapes philippinarum TaxID=129788 RepID=UPI00295B578A